MALGFHNVFYVFSTAVGFERGTQETHFLNLDSLLPSHSLRSLSWFYKSLLCALCFQGTYGELMERLKICRKPFPSHRRTFEKILLKEEEEEEARTLEGAMTRMRETLLQLSRHEGRQVCFQFNEALVCSREMKHLLGQVTGLAACVQERCCAQVLCEGGSAL